jgi:tetratricopeptide (TPR) repeat protein
VLVGLLASAASARIWTDITGKGKVDAEYLGVEDGKVKLQINPGGVVKVIPLGALCPEDQEFIKQQAAREEAERDAAAGRAPDPFTEAIKARPTEPELYINRGMARTNRKDFDGAIKDFSKAIELDAKSAHAYNGRGLALQKKNDLVAAQKDFNEAIRLDPKLASAYRNRGENLRRVALDPKQHIKEFDEYIDQWQKFWNHARKDNLSKTPWQPLHATKGDVSRQAAMQQMAKIDIEFAERLEREWGDHGGWSHGGGGRAHGGHGPGCTCPACSGCAACPQCHGMGCPACNGGKPAPGLGVYPPQCMKGEKITLVANASQLAKGMPAEAKPGQRGRPGPTTPIPVGSVDFYRDANGDGGFQADTDQYLGSDAEGKDGYTLEVSTDNFPPGPQSFFAVGRGAPGSGKGATPEQLMAAADELEKAVEQEKAVAQKCDSGKEQGLPAEQCQGATGDQQKVADAAQKVAEKIGKAAPDVADLLKKASTPMKAVKNRLATAEKRPGEPNKGDCENAGKKATEAVEKLAQAASKLREAAEAAKACGTPNPGQAPADAAVGMPTSGANEILAAAPIGARGVGGGGGDGGHGDHGDHGDRHDEDWTEEVVDEDTVADQADEYVEEGDYDRAVVEYDRLLRADPENVTYLRDRAATQLLRGGYDYAIRDYDRLLKVNETDADLYYNRGCAQLAAGRLQEALSDFTKSISLNETYSLAYNNRGATYARLGQFDRAIADFSKAIEIEPSNRLAYRNRGMAYKKLGELRKAEADMQVMAKLEQEKKDSGSE